MNEIEIIKDLEIELFYAVIQNKHDDEDERSIVGYGTNEAEALLYACKNILKAQQNCIKLLEELNEKFGNSSCLNNDDFYLKYTYVKKPVDMGDGRILESYDALVFDKELKRWHRLYR